MDKIDLLCSNNHEHQTVEHRQVDPNEQHVTSNRRPPRPGSLELFGDSLCPKTYALSLGMEGVHA
jgi:hypothetical protein